MVRNWRRLYQESALILSISCIPRHTFVSLGHEGKTILTDQKVYQLPAAIGHCFSGLQVSIRIFSLRRQERKLTSRRRRILRMCCCCGDDCECRPLAFLLGLPFAFVSLLLSIIGVIIWIVGIVLSCICPCCFCVTLIVEFAIGLIKAPFLVMQWFISKIPC
ncbi:Signaling peptide TAXIMIN 1 [Linum perenne]